MKSFRYLQIASVVLLLTQLNLVKSAGQTNFVNGGTAERNAVKDNSAKAGGDVVSPSLPSPVATDDEKGPLTDIIPPLLPTALKTTDPRKFGLIDRAYLDAFTILNDENQCSRLFGGRRAITALTELVRQLKPRYLGRDIAIRMTGPITTVQSHATCFTFRLFEKAEINLSGSFFRDAGRGGVSSAFPANTRETRVVVLLHELGHLVRGADKQWVLPDDGDDNEQSLENTERVVNVCRQEIDSLSKFSAAQELEMANGGSRTELAQR